ncbi:gpi inositol-deacylase [Colletotrichum karsti]|uniref:GPI inositol-deacylase n=1 Tax=Colletotrichum karsti TaxID=1095194 RepID=A0A9P6ID51_9PEZI|nr:gpi inositol-deacylase [Colletotrichum karsti]KAF9881393.1 gpi inositol-deacylase [Colletotrichum karsti]
MKRRSSGSTDDSDDPPITKPRSPATSKVTSDTARTRNSAAHPKHPPAASRPASARSRRSPYTNWKFEHGPNGSLENHSITVSSPSTSPSPSPSSSSSPSPSTLSQAPSLAVLSPAYPNNLQQPPDHQHHQHHRHHPEGGAPHVEIRDESDDDTETDNHPGAKASTASERMAELRFAGRRSRFRGPWSITILALAVTVLGITLLCAILNSSWTRQLDAKGCRMSYMRPSYIRLRDFDTEHTRFATKYSLYLYREQGVDDERKACVPVLFIPGNAGSYKQVRPIAAEAANYYHESLQHDEAAAAAGARNLDFFTVDFNEDITAFHGQTMLDQAEYLNEAIRYILSLYMDPRMSARDPDLPDPTSVLILGHSMGGIVARTMLIMPNYQSHSINTIITMSAPHSRPPVTFDGQIVKIYEDINDYWRRAYSQKWANNNPLWHVTLVSIAGGGLDTVVPSDYASVESIIPETHGFTVFTTGIPGVWTSMDHQAILWCDQFRKVVARALYDIADVHRSSQTKPRAERMRVFKKWFLTGMESIAEKNLPSEGPTTLLTLEDNANAIMGQGERLILRELGLESKPRAYLLPVPPQGSPEGKRFTLLSDVSLDKSGEHGKLEVLFCSVFPLQPGQATTMFSVNMDLSGDSTGSTRLACKNTASDAMLLPASTKSLHHPFALDNEPATRPFSYLEFDTEDIADHQFVAIIDKAVKPSHNFVVADFSDHAQSHRTRNISLRRLLAFGMTLRLPADRPMVAEINIPTLQSSLLAYNLEMSNQVCNGAPEMFSPLIRQHLAQPYESKYFVNARHASISMHGVAPFVPPPLRQKRHDEQGLSFQFWTDPTCESSIQVKLTVDALGSLGKLYMRYRTVFAAFPLLVVTLVLRKQFRVYDTTGTFISFSESLDLCLRQSLPLMLVSLTFLSLSMTGSWPAGPGGFWHWRNTTSPAGDFHGNDLLTGTQDPFFWFLVPLIGVVCVGVCAILHFVTLALTQLLGFVYSSVVVRSFGQARDERRRAHSPMFASSSPRRRMITTAILLFMVSTFIPYQFAYLVACLVQLFTVVRALRIASELKSGPNYDFYHYAHSILLLMLWVLPINLPILAVWIRNLAVHWLTPFSSHHNVLSIMPFILLVENLTTGKMVPRVAGKLRHLTSVLLFGTATYAAIYGVSYAYMLHYLVNLVAAWLVVIHSTSDNWPLAGFSSIFENGLNEDRKGGKAP